MKGSRLRRALAALLLIAGLAVAFEASSYVLWWVSEGSPFSYAEARRLAQESAAGGRLAEERRAAWTAGRERRIATAEALAPFLRHESLHPFLGYVIDPVIDELAEPPFPGLGVSPHGFFASHGAALPRQPGTEPLRVAVFGGSVAFVFSMQGSEPLARGLAAAGVSSPGGVEIVSRALGGWKQPQQLMALAWFLAHGERYDAVVVLDGFNELVLAELENFDRDVYPFYPRGWRLRVRGVPDAALEERVGELAFLRRRRAERATAFAAGPWRRTVTGSLVWRALDRLVASEIGRAQAAVAEWRMPGRPFFAHGPEIAAPDGAALHQELAAFWARASRQMHDLATARGIAYAHFLQPNQYVPGSKPLSDEERRTAFSPDSLYRPPVVAGWPDFQQAGEELAAEGIAFHDLTRLFADVEETLYIDDCCHLNPRGNELLGEAIGRALAAELREVAAGEDGATAGAASPLSPR